MCVVVDSIAVDVLLLLLLLVLLMVSVLVEAIEVVELVLVVVLPTTITANGFELVSLTMFGLSTSPGDELCPSRCRCAAAVPRTLAVTAAGTADRFDMIKSESFA